MSTRKMIQVNSDGSETVTSFNSKNQQIATKISKASTDVRNRKAEQEAAKKRKETAKKRKSEEIKAKRAAEKAQKEADKKADLEKRAALKAQKIEADNKRKEAVKAEKQIAADKKAKRMNNSKNFIENRMKTREAKINKLNGNSSDSDTPEVTKKFQTYAKHVKHLEDRIELNMNKLREQIAYVRSIRKELNDVKANAPKPTRVAVNSDKSSKIEKLTKAQMRDAEILAKKNQTSVTVAE